MILISTMQQDPIEPIPHLIFFFEQLPHLIWLPVDVRLQV